MIQPLQAQHSGVIARVSGTVSQRLWMIAAVSFFANESACRVQASIFHMALSGNTSERQAASYSLGEGPVAPSRIINPVHIGNFVLHELLSWICRQYFLL